MAAKYGIVDYPRAHFAFQNEPDYVVCRINVTTAKMQTLGFVLKLNPTDCRGYRMILKLIASDAEPEIAMNLNREWADDEIEALYKLMSYVVIKGKALAIPAVQTEVAGNNSMALDAEGNVLIGLQDEPCQLKAHIRFAGNPAHEYIPGVPLQGPIPGELFNQRVGKIPWDPAKLKLARDYFEKLFTPL